MPRLVYTPLAQLQEGANRVTGPNTNYALPAINRSGFNPDNVLFIKFLTCRHAPASQCVPLLTRDSRPLMCHLPIQLVIAGCNARCHAVIYADQLQEGFL